MFESGRPADPVDDAIAWARTRNVSDGQIALAVEELLRTTAGCEALSPRMLVAAEIGAALSLGTGAATKLVDTVITLNTRLRATFAAVIRGELDWCKAVILAEATGALSAEHAREVETAVLAKAAERTPARHADAVRRAVARIDPDGADARRRDARRTVRMIRAHHGNGMGVLFTTMASDQLDTVYSGADLWARSRKADGDPRTLDQLRVAAMVQWAQSFLHHGDPTYCDRWCTPGSHGPGAGTDDGGPDDEGSAGPDDGPGGGNGPGGSGPCGGGPGGDGPDGRPLSHPPRRHGRPAALTALWDLESFLGLASRCGELADSGAVLPPEAMRELVGGGVRIRRMVIDDATGQLLDLTPRTWWLPRAQPTELDAPVVLSLILTRSQWDAIRAGTAAPALQAAVNSAPRAVQHLLAHQWTAGTLDHTPAAYPAPARLAEFVAVRDRHPVNPAAGPTAAAAADLDHTRSVRSGGPTTRNNLAAVVRRWHRLKTHGGWTSQRTTSGWTWTSPRGHSYRTEPYDYRLGP